MRTDAKEQAPYTLCMPCSINNDPTYATRRNKRASHCIFIVLSTKIRLKPCEGTGAVHAGPCRMSTEKGAQTEKKSVL